MAIGKGNNEATLLLATVQPTRSQRRLAFALALGLLVTFGAAAPFAAMPLPQLYALIPAVVAIYFLSDLITAVLLFAQFAIMRSRALLILANGYLFVAWIVIAGALTYPGLFSPTGLLGAGLQTTSWLYFATRFGFTGAVFGYALLKDSTYAVTIRPEVAIWRSVAITSFFVCALTWLFVGGNDFLPRLVLDATTYSPLVFYLAVLLVLFIAIVFAFLWMRQRSVLDQWLLVAVFAFLLEVTISNLLPAARFAVGFYVGIVFRVINTTILMVILLAETTRLYARIVHSHGTLQRERQNKLFSLEAMAASISHEVRQPLGAILINSEAAASCLEQTPPELAIATEALRDISSDVHRTTEIFKSIGALFGRGDQQLVPVDINDVAADALRIMRGQIEDRGIRAHADLAPKLPQIMGDRGQLQEVIVNLIHNGIDAMSATGAEERLLTIISHANDHAVILAVRDTGPGIDPDKLDKLFDAFVTTKSGGMGLGLAICRTIIERHGGQISAWSSGQQKGTVFQLTLPINPLP
jgi:signal transduction histidine kinase